MNNIPIINIHGRRKIEYIFDVLSKLNNPANKNIILRGIGNNINKAIEIAQILNSETQTQIKAINFENILIKNHLIPILNIPLDLSTNSILIKDAQPPVSWIDKDFEHEDFINYSTYHLLFDLYLQQGKQIQITYNNKDNVILTIYQKNNINYINIEQSNNDTLNKIISSLYRCGYLIPENWETVINKLTDYDDVILGLDTNILYNSFITEGLLPMMPFIKPRKYVHIPNWLLIIIPSAVLNELEEASNIKDQKGNIIFQGRMGYRAIQEIMELSQNIDISGLSVMITGETDTSLHLNENIKQLRMDLYKMFLKLYPQEDSNFIGNVKTSSGDITIRTQFKKFLQAIDFHKGTFFLTADKTCAALATAEGLNSLYVKYNHNLKNTQLSPINFYDAISSEKIYLNVPIGSILYELVVSFGIIGVKIDNRNILLKTDYKGERLDRWVHKQIKIKKNDLEYLLLNYHGILHLERAFSLLRKLTDHFEIIRWGTDFDSAFNN